MTYKDLRQKARDNLRNNWTLSIAVAAVAVLVGGIGTSFIPNLEYTLTELTSDWPLLDGGSFRISLDQGILSLSAFLLGGTLELGYCQYLLKQHDQEELQFSELFSQFYRYGTGFAQSFLRGLYCLLWGLLFIIPGIVKAYAYAMTPYILADHPELTAGEAIERSKLMMDGHKGELFILHLTFFGWNILASLCWNLGYLALNPYTKAAEAAFYRELVARQSRPQLTEGDFTV